MVRKNVFVVLLALLSASSIFADTPGAYRKIPAKDAKSMIDKGGVTIVDVRRPEEYAAGHIPGAVLVTLQTLEQTSSSVLPDKNAVLLVYCRTGIRSANASDKLIKMGYKNVYDIAGGITQWPYDITAEK